MGETEIEDPLAPGPRRQGLIDALRMVVREELLGTVGSGDVLPPPCDPDAELTVLNAVLNGVVNHANMPSLQGSDFYSEVWGRVYEASRRTTSIAELAYSACKAGLHNGNSILLSELNDLRNHFPLIDAVKARSSYERIVELSERRHLLTRIQSICRGLRGDLSADDAIRRLAEL